MTQLKITPSITNRDDISLKKYLQDIGHEELISAEEEVELARRIHQGDRKALEKLTKANLRFVVSVAKQYQNKGLSLADLINEGNMGLIKAAENFDETRGFKFISYAVWWIRQRIRQAIAEQSRMVRLPQNKIDALSTIINASKKFEQEHGRQPSTEELSRIVDMPEEKITATMEVSTRHTAIDKPITGEDDSTLIDIIPDSSAPTVDVNLLRESLRTEIAAILNCLTEKERKIVESFYGINSPEMTLDEIGIKYGLSRERVRQIKEKAIRRLRNNTKNDELKTYL